MRFSGETGARYPVNLSNTLWELPQFHEATIARFSSARTKNGQLPEPSSDRISTLPLEKLSALLMRRSCYLKDNLGTPKKLDF